MKPLTAVLAGAALALLPELLRIGNDERKRAHEAALEARKRAHEAEQKNMDRANALAIARIAAEAKK